ncbi:MAG: hypothetical protein H6Q73_4355 [Firmicutes bacterium]|nr:hypothetical protein [Bacillota bacterium]
MSMRDNTEKHVATKLGVKPEEAFRMINVSRSLGYKLIAEGVIPSVKLGEKRLIVPVSGLEKLMNGSGN